MVAAAAAAAAGNSTVYAKPIGVKEDTGCCDRVHYS